MSDTTACHRIGEAARRSGVSAANIRYYEKEGLLAPGSRSSNSYRLYSRADIHQLRFIRLCRAMDMSLDEVRTLLALDLASKADCDAACVALDGHLDPSGTTHAYAKAARMGGAEIVLHNRVLETNPRPDGSWEVVTEKGTVIAQHVC